MRERVLFEELSWMDVEQYLEKEDRVVVVTGSCEQHGYLSLLTDIRSPLAIAQAACRQEGVLIAPPLPYGVSPYFTAFPGTLSLSPKLFVEMVQALLGGLLAQGFRRLLVCNGHGGNSGLLGQLLVQVGIDHPEAKLAVFQWWRHPAIRGIAEAVGLPLCHANWMENSAVTRVGPVPEGTKEPVDLSRSDDPVAFRQDLGDGSFGGPYQAPQEVTDQLFAAAVAEMVKVLQHL